MQRPLAALSIVAALSCCPPAFAVVTYSTVGVYDEQVNQVNTVDTNASGNPLASPLVTDVAGFKTLVGFAYLSDDGGIVNFDRPNNALTNVTNDTGGFTATFGANNTKTLPVTVSTAQVGGTGGQLNHTTFTGLLPISGATPTDSKGLIPSNSQNTAFRLIFGSIIGGDPGEALSQIGFTLLSRDSTAQNVLVEAFLNGNTATPFASDTETFAAGRGVDDTFFSFVAPAGSAITSVRFQWGNTGDARLAIDDFGFVTTSFVIPEPGTGMLAICGMTALAALRRRRA